MNVYALIRELTAFPADAAVTIVERDGTASPAVVERVPVEAVRCDDPDRVLVNVELIAGLSLRDQEENRERDERGDRADDS